MGVRVWQPCALRGAGGGVRRRRARAAPSLPSLLHSAVAQAKERKGMRGLWCAEFSLCVCVCACGWVWEQPYEEAAAKERAEYDLKYGKTAKDN
eukprot:661718-Rhodomonas_salina.1